MQFAMPSMTPMVRRLVIATSAVFALTFLVYLVAPEAARAIVDVFAISPEVWRSWFPILPLWQLVSWGFLHSFQSPFHILGNMLFLYFLGTLLEGIVGSRPFLFTYLSALVVAGVVTLVVGLVASAASGFPAPPTLGASGAVLAIVVATAVLRPNTRVIFLLFPITLKTLALFYVGFDVFYMLSELRGGASSNVAHTAHLVGAGWGFLLARQGWIWRDPMQSFESWRARKDDERKVLDEGRLDALLEKINKHGIHSLTSGEKAFLKRTSRRR